MILRVLLIAAILVCAVAAGRELALADAPPAAFVLGVDGNTREYGYGLVRMNGHGPEWHRWEKVKADRRGDKLQRRLTMRVLQVRTLKRTLAHDGSAQEAIALAATVYGNGPMLLRRAKCESHLNPNAKNRSSSAAGLFQFLDSTWASTPFAGFSVYSPYANALAAGWMHGPAGRSSEWVCA